MQMPQWYQRRLVTISVECAFNHRAPYAMYCFCRLSGLTWVAWACIAAYGKCALIRIGDQPPLQWHGRGASKIYYLRYLQDVPLNSKHTEAQFSQLDKFVALTCITCIGAQTSRLGNFCVYTDDDRTDYPPSPPCACLWGYKPWCSQPLHIGVAEVLQKGGMQNFVQKPCKYSASLSQAQMKFANYVVRLLCQEPQCY